MRISCFRRRVTNPKHAQRERRIDSAAAPHPDSDFHPLQPQAVAPDEALVTTPLWYVLGFAFAGATFVLITIVASWLLSHRTKGDRHKGLPYESGIDTFGYTWGRVGLSFYIYALL